MSARIRASLRYALVLAIVPALAPARTLAQDDEVAHMRPEIVAKAMLGLGGKAADGGSVDLDPTFAGAVHYEHPLHRYFVLGGYLAVASWNTSVGNDIGYDRSLMTDISVLPKLRLPLERELELYLAFPAGLTLDFGGGDSIGATSSDVGLGYNVHALFGGQLGFTDDLGLMGEMGYGLHHFSHTYDTPVGTVDVSPTLQQFVITLGMYFQL